MKKLVLGILLSIFIYSCGNRPKESVPMLIVAEEKIDTVSIPSSDTLGYVEEVLPVEHPQTDEHFENFIYAYASDERLQRKRTRFPLSYYEEDKPMKIEEKDWIHDSLFIHQSHYTLLFDHEDELELVGDSLLTSVQFDWIYLATAQVKRYYFERIEGKWMLEAINLRHIEELVDESFVNFYAKFVADTAFQSRHIHQPLIYVTIDPDDEFSLLETTLDLNQWFAFEPMLPQAKLTNICYGQHNEDHSDKKILKVNGIDNGYTNIFYFQRREGEWELYKYEDAGI